MTLKELHPYACQKASQLRTRRGKQRQMLAHLLRKYSL
jgi:hypothetical protein